MSEKSQGNLLATLIGLGIGVGVTVIGAVALSDKKNQNKIGSFWTKLISHLNGSVQELENQAYRSKSKLKKSANQAINKVERLTASAKKEVRKI
jgi:hypothetical protein